MSSTDGPLKVESFRSGEALLIVELNTQTNTQLPLVLHQKLRPQFHAHALPGQGR